jgi:uncharacterized protein (TIGR03083 family)
VGEPSWNFQEPAGRARLLGVLRRESDAMFALAAEPANWHVPTACAGWEVRDMVGHLVDATESYLAGFQLARDGGPAPPAVGLSGMAGASNEAALSFRSVARDELLERYRIRTSEVLHEFEALSDAEWTDLIVPDHYMGPLPAMIIAVGLLGGYVVHGWDVREGLRAPHVVPGDAADLLVPFIFLLWWATADTAGVGAPYAIGIRTTGHNGGDTRCDVSADGLQFAPDHVDDCPAILECDPATLVLTAYNRINAGTVRGDPQLVTEFRSLFVSI